MKKFTFLVFCLLLCSGCATYRYGKGQSPYDKGYVVTRQNIAIPEYTLGKDNTVPADLKVAKERFKRRKVTVEKYYKKMGLVENRFKQYIFNNMVNMLKLIGGVLTLPYRAYEDYRYTNNKAYHEKVVRESEQEDSAEKAKMKTLHQELNAYIQEDLAKEPPIPEAAIEEIPAASAPEPPGPEVKIETSAEVPAVKEPLPVQTVQPPVEEVKAEAPAVVQQPAPKQKTGIMESILKQLSGKDKPKAKPRPKPKPGVIGQPKAVISARPQKGASPLKVQFYGSGSYSKSAKIISYEWDFGDGDKSTDRNPVNTFWCKSFGTTQFEVTLTVKDTNGNTDTARAIVEVKTKPVK